MVLLARWHGHRALIPQQPMQGGEAPGSLPRKAAPACRREPPSSYPPLIPEVICSHAGSVGVLMNEWKQSLQYCECTATHSAAYWGAYPRAKSRRQPSNPSVAFSQEIQSARPACTSSLVWSRSVGGGGGEQVGVWGLVSGG